MKMNINEEVYVRLTSHGFETWSDWKQKIETMTKWPGPSLPTVANTEWCKFAMWELMNIFGQAMYNGSDQQFIDNEIRFDRPI